MPILYESYNTEYNTEEPPSKLVDWWTVAHLVVGLGSGLIFKIPTSPWAFIASGWEIVEQTVILEKIPEWKETAANSAIDIIIGIAGNYAGNKIRETLAG